MIRYITNRERYEKEIKKQLKNRELLVLNIDKIKENISIRQADNLLRIKSKLLYGGEIPLFISFRKVYKG